LRGAYVLIIIGSLQTFYW